MSHYKDQEERFCNKCRTYCDHSRNNERMIYTCECGYKEQDYNGNITTREERHEDEKPERLARIRAMTVDAPKQYGKGIVESMSGDFDTLEKIALDTKGQAKETPIKSDGGSSSYYQLKLLVKSNKIKELEGHDEVKVVDLETGDIIRALVDNDFDLGNIIKACRRIHQAKIGTGKAGTDVEYDCKKIDYFLKEWYNAYTMEQL